MSSEKVFEFLESTLLDLHAREAAQEDPEKVMTEHDLSQSEKASILRRMTVKEEPDTKGQNVVMRHHYASMPFARTESLTDSSVKDRIQTVDQTFDVKPIVVITTTTTTITVTVSPSPTPSPTPSEKPPEDILSIQNAALEVKSAVSSERVAKLMQLALAIEASAA